MTNVNVTELTMAEFRCPQCAQGTMRTDTVLRHSTRLNGVPICVENASIERCDVCGETSVTATELKRWEAIRDDQLRSAGQTPSQREVRMIRESLRMSVSDFASLLGVTRQTVAGWEHPDTGGIKLGPAALLVQILGAEKAGRISTVRDYLLKAAQSRDHAATDGARTESTQPAVLA